MKKKPASKSAFFNQRVLIGFSFCLIGLVLALLAFAAYPGGNAFARQDQAAAPAVVQQNAAAPDALGTAQTFLSHDLLTPEQVNAAALDNSLPQSPDQASCARTVLATDGSTSGNGRAPSTRFNFIRSVYLLTPAELAADGFLSGTTISTVGWNYQAAPVTGGSAPLIIYLQNTADTTNTKSTTWATAITGMTMAHSATTALPGVIGPFDITLTGGSPFTYTGGGLYVAFDWGQYTGTLSTTAVIATNVSLVGGLLGAQGAAQPTTVAASNFRPETRLSSTAANDAAVHIVSSFGELPLGLVPPQAVRGVVNNKGTSTLTNLQTTLNVTGANSFTNMQTIASLTGCTGQGTATFAGFTPTGAGATTVGVSVPADDIAVNNTLSKALNVTSLDYSYKHPGSTATGGVGVNGATAALVGRFNVTAANAVTAVKLEFPAAVPTTTYRVAIYAESAPGSGTPALTPIYLDAANRPAPVAGPVTHTLDVASVAVGPGNFFVGAHQTNTVNMGMSYDVENPIRSGSFFLAIPTGSAFFDAAPGNNFKLNIGLILQTPGPSPTPSPTPPVTPTPSATVAPSATPSATVSPTPCTQVINGSMDAADPDFTRPNTFAQGGSCTTDGTHNYDAYEFNIATARSVTASLCGGATWDTYVMIYQAPGGVQIPGFVPAGCTNAIVANDDFCGLQSQATANLVAGFYYVVVSEFSAPGGAYTLTVTGCPPTPTPTPSATVSPSGTPTPSPTPSAGPINCTSGPGLIIHDDNTIENGYGGNPANTATFNVVDRFTPAAFPASVQSACVAFLTIAGTPTTLNYSVIVYDDDGPAGAPGTELGVLPDNAVAIPGGITPPVFQTTDLSSLGLNVASGSVYIGVRYTPATPNVFVASDESTTNPVGFAGGFARFDPLAGGTGTWGTIQTSFAAYRSMFIRATLGAGGASPTPSPSITPTPCPGGTNVILDGTFEAGSPWTAWTVQTSTNFGTPMCDVACGTGGGTAGGFGGSANWAWFGGIAAAETATAGQSVVIASGGVASLTFQLWIGAVNAPATDVLNVRVDGTIVASFPEPATPEPGYTLRTVDVGAFANGASHAVLFEYIGPAGGGVGNFSVDNVSLIAGGVCATPSPSATASPSCIPSSGWSAGPAAPPVGLVRAPGNFFPANGRFYSIGGRNADVAGADFVNPFEYDPVANSWATKPSTLPDGVVNNMACGVLNAGSDLIYCVGGSQSQVVGTASRVFTYNPATDTFATLPAGDNWPGSQGGTFLPGGFAVAANKLYIIGSFNANAVPPVVTNQVWQFDPNAASGSRWVAQSNYPVARGYVPAASIGGKIYTGGGSNLDPGGVLIDSAESFVFDPAVGVGGTWTAIANIPRPTGETRAVVMNGQMWVLGGGRVAPNPSNQVNIFDPIAGTWSLGQPFTTGRRNFPADSNGTDRIFLAGGYDSSGTTLLNTMEIFGAGVCASPTPSATPPTPTPTATASPSATESPSATPTPSASPTATAGETPTPTPTPGVSPPGQPVNLSTRMKVLAGAADDPNGNNIGIGGFIVTGSGPKNVIVRAIGPSLVRFGIPLAEVLADPTLELRSSNALIRFNNNWKDDAAQRQLIEDTGLPPTHDLESAIVATLNPGQYTAIVRGNGGTSGVALVEVYDLNQSSGSQLANISTRAFVNTNDNIVIAGFILGNNSGDDSVILRGMGPSLAAAGVPNVLANPTLELRDNNAALIVSNNDWQDDPDNAALITAAGLAPSNNLEAAIAATLPPGLYTALLAGLNGGIGNGLVEVYDLGAPAGGGPAPTPTPTPPGGTPTPPPSPSPGVTPPLASPTPSIPPPATPTPSPPIGPCIENFDGPPPTLPLGWTAELTTGDPPTWETTAGSPDGGNGPNLFVNDQDGISEKRVISRDITINSASSVLSFRNNYDTEYDPPPAEVFWDGFVLDISTDGGANWTDVIDAGGVFVSRPYDGEITGQANNPIAGRMAWCGDSGGYVDTVINLPASLNGQTIKLRFIMGTDEALAQPGAHVDVLTITNASCPPP